MQGEFPVRARRQDGRLVVAVADTGPGISPEDAEVIFEPFSQGVLETSRSEGGSGLGLSISKQFVQLHRGRMWVESELGVGSTFYFELPLAPPGAEPAGPARWIRQDWVWRERAFATGSAALGEQVRRPRVLVLDGAGELCRRLSDTNDEVELVEVSDADQLADELERCPARLVIAHAPTPAETASLVDRTASGVPGYACDRLLEHACQPDGRQRPARPAYLTKPVSRDDLRRDSLDTIAR